MASIEDLLAQAQPVTRSVRLCLRGDLAAQRDDLARQLDEAQLDEASENQLPDRSLVIAQALADAEAEAVEATTEFKVKAIPSADWSKLARAYPPSEEEAKAGNEYGAKFLPAILSACVLEPAMTFEQAEQLEEVLSTAQFLKLWNAVISANLGDDDLPKSDVAIEALRSSMRNSTTASL